MDTSMLGLICLACSDTVYPWYCVVCQSMNCVLYLSSDETLEMETGQWGFFHIVYQWNRTYSKQMRGKVLWSYKTYQKKQHNIGKICSPVWNLPSHIRKTRTAWKVPILIKQCFFTFIWFQTVYITWHDMTWHTHSKKSIYYLVILAFLLTTFYIYFGTKDTKRWFRCFFAPFITS